MYEFVLAVGAALGLSHMGNIIMRAHDAVTPAEVQVIIEDEVKTIVANTAAERETSRKRRERAQQVFEETYEQTGSLYTAGLKARATVTGQP